MNMFQSKTIQPLEIRHISFTSISGNTYEKPIMVVFHQIKEGFANNMISLVTNYVITVLVDGVLYCLRSCLFFTPSRTGLSLRGFVLHYESERGGS